MKDDDPYCVLVVRKHNKSSFMLFSDKTGMSIGRRNQVCENFEYLIPTASNIFQIY